MKDKPIILGIISVAVATGVIGGILLINNNANQGNSTAQTSSPATDKSSQNQPTATIAEGAYKDGVYMATGTYRSPAGTDEIDVTLTLAGGKVNAVDIVGRARSGTSREYIQDFSSGVSGQVVGKKLDDLSNLATINGASLTTIGFKSAVEEIKSQASN